MSCHHSKQSGEGHRASNGCSDQLNDSKHPQELKLETVMPSNGSNSSITSTPTEVTMAADRPLLIRRPSLITPRMDKETQKCCGCCHKPLRQSISSQPGHFHRPHSPLDECCGAFCPDIHLPDGDLPSPRHHQRRRSRLSDQEFDQMRNDSYFNDVTNSLNLDSVQRTNESK